MALLDQQVSAHGLNGVIEAWEDLGIPEKLLAVLKPRSRYKVAHGGRAGMKSWSFARALLWRGKIGRERILCTRELQKSIKQSVHKLLCDQIDLLGFQDHYRSTDKGIFGLNGTEFIFEGLRNNVQEIKSLEGVTICWVEEAQKTSKESWRILVPTIRKAGSEIWVSLNEDLEDDPTAVMLLRENKPPGTLHVKMNWRDNPFISQELLIEKDYLAKTDPEAYENVWEGGFRKFSEACIFKDKYRIEYFEAQPHWAGPYLGSDLGFANDPATLVRCWIEGRTLYVEELVYQIGLEIDDMPLRFQNAGCGSYLIKADNSRPETISYLRRHGLNIAPCVKGPGSVEDGIKFLRSFEAIVIHSESRHFQEEARLYSYKVDRLSGEVLPIIVDAHNHCWDPARYALEPVMKNTLFAGCDLS